MNFTTRLELPFQLGGTVEENIDLLDDYFFNNKTFGTDLEGFLITDPGDEHEETWKIVSIIEDGKCVTARFDFDNDNVTFADVPIGPDNGGSEDETAASLRAQGFEVIAQEFSLVLPEHFITIEPGLNLCYWDRNHWTHEEFLEETVVPE